jgi:hypothetical protein
MARTICLYARSSEPVAIRPAGRWCQPARSRRLLSMREALITTTLLGIVAAARGSALAIGAIQATTQTRPTR